jgi:multidrug resistance efflux pump
MSGHCGLQEGEDAVDKNSTVTVKSAKKPPVSLATREAHRRLKEAKHQVKLIKAKLKLARSAVKTAKAQRKRAEQTERASRVAATPAKGSQSVLAKPPKAVPKKPVAAKKVARKKKAKKPLLVARKVPALVKTTVRPKRARKVVKQNPAVEPAPAERPDDGHTELTPDSET